MRHRRHHVELTTIREGSRHRALCSIEMRRGRQLVPGDRVVLAGEESVVAVEEATGP